MNLVTSRAGWRSLLQGARDSGSTIGLVPTMGALHAGHLSLVAAARADCDFVGVTIFVNPTQFGDAGDLAAYPRDLGADLLDCESAGADAVFAPSDEEMYPGGPPPTTVSPGRLGEILEGASRPGHFSGVATIVTRLFALAGPCRAYFGEKDYQQLTVIRQLVADLDIPVEVRGCPIVRESDGLAMSSRNGRLGPEGRQAALALHRALDAGASLVAAGVTEAALVEGAMMAVLEDEPEVRPDYAVAADPHSLDRLELVQSGARLLVAGVVDGVRLIDNAEAPVVPAAASSAPAPVKMSS